MASNPRTGPGAPRNDHRSPVGTALLFFGALLFLFEEWLWTGLTQFFAWLGRLGLLRWVDARLVRLPPVMALVVLCTPMLLLFPFKIAGLWMIASGRFFSGCALMLAAKVLSTAIIARIFLTCRPQLMRMPWFARLYAWTCVLRDRIHQWIDQQPAWYEARGFVRRARVHLRAWSRGPAYRRGALRRLR
ncbi:MAG: hypothetical protein ABI277_08055, partial [Burkholderiaceae bacterium]